MDSKKELEKLLKATCEAFIMSVTKLTVEPMLSFITKVAPAPLTQAVFPPCCANPFCAVMPAGPRSPYDGQAEGSMYVRISDHVE